MSEKFPERKTCRISGEELVPLFSLGQLYVSDFLPEGEPPRMKHKVELKLCLAPESGLVQLAHTAPFDEMYGEYWYRSGTNATMTRELQDIAESTQNLIRWDPGDIFLDIASNDGTLLRFVDGQMIRIGIDPVEGDYRDLALKHADDVVQDYFSKDVYYSSAHATKKAKIITSIAMFYDLDDPHSFVEDVSEVLDDNGLWVIQMSYLPLMLQQLAFDNICHEHLEYYSLSSLKYLLDAHNLKIVDCQLNDINGGSFRVYVQKNSADPASFGTSPYRDVASYRVQSILSHEKSLNLKDPNTYKDFYAKVEKLKKETVDFIKKEKAVGKKIWAYGASTKGNTLLQWFGLDNTLIDGIAERSPAKFGRRTVGTNIPIYSEEEAREAQPDYFLVLPWHFIKEFTEREQKYLKAGGKFIVPCPKFEVIEG